MSTCIYIPHKRFRHPKFGVTDGNPSIYSYTSEDRKEAWLAMHEKQFWAIAKELEEKGESFIAEKNPWIDIPAFKTKITELTGRS